jgi:Immunoglobulin-like domain of bacterial spore germination
MTNPTEELESRVSAVLRAEVGGVRPGDDSLDVIRGRARVARQRRRMLGAGLSAAAVLAAAVAVPLLRDDDRDRVSTGSDTAPTTAVPDTTAPDITPTTGAPVTPAVDYSQAVWPDPSGELFTDPVEAASSFMLEVMGVDIAPLSDFVPGQQDGGGTIDVYQLTENGSPSDRVASTISLRRLDGEHWFVTLATSTDVRIGVPAPGDEVSFPLAVGGEARGYEATIMVQLLARASGAPVLTEAVAMAGSAEALEPFEVQLAEIGTPPTSGGIVIASATSGADTAVPPFAAVPVVLDNAAGAGSGNSGSGGGVVPADGDYEFPAPALWPFRTQAEADAWLAQADEGHSPWHADAEATALAFTQGFLGFADIDLVTSRDVRADEAWIGVGFQGEDATVTAAVVHLRRFGPSSDAPWEVVGTRDTDLTLDRPDYGSTVSSPVVVGGSVTGLEGSLTVSVRQVSAPEPLGGVADLVITPQTSAWDAEIPYAGATDPALTIVVSLRSDAREAARFAITAVRP